MPLMWTNTRCFGLGALAALGWITATALDPAALDILPQTQRPLVSVLPLWARMVARTLLVLSIPVLLLLRDQAARSWLGRHSVFVLAILASALLLAALPALVPVSSPEGVLSLPLRVPTASLGLALGVGDGARGVYRPQPGEDDPSPGVVAGLGFGVILVVIYAALGFILLIMERVTPSCAVAPACGAIRPGGVVTLCGLPVICGVTGIVAGSLGYTLGCRLSRITKQAAL